MMVTTAVVIWAAWYDLPYIREIVEEQHENVSIKPSGGFAFSKNYLKPSFSKR